MIIYYCCTTHSFEFLFSKDIFPRVIILVLFSLLDFQNYLRTQTGNNTTVNIIISTVDYLLRVQVSLQ